MHEKLRAARRKRHWTIEEAAELIGVSRQTYLRWEKGGQHPHNVSLRKPCEVYECDAFQLGFEELSPITRAIVPQRFLAEGDHSGADGAMLDLRTTLALVWQRERCSLQEFYDMVRQAMNTSDPFESCRLDAQSS